MRTRGAPPAFIEEVFAPSASQSATDRLGVYHRAYWQRQVSALADTFHNCAAALGAAEFERLALAYIQLSPGQDPCIERLGRGFPDFLAERPQLSPTALGLARLECAELEALLALDPQAVLRAPAQSGAAFAGSQLAFVPSLQVARLPRAAWLALGYPVQAAPEDDGSMVEIAVWRPGFAVQRVLLEEDEARALELARGGATLAVLCAAFTQLAEEAAIARALRVLSSWFARKWITRSQPSDAISAW